MNDPQRVADVKAQLEEAGVAYCFATYVDIHGVPKAKAVPLASFEKMCAGSELFTVGAMEGMGLVGPEKDECAVVPDLDSMIIFPWDTRFAWFSGDLFYHGEPYPNCSRTILKRVLANAATDGVGLNLGVETEFYVFRDAAGKQPLAERRHLGMVPAYDVDQTIQAMPYLDRMVSVMNTLGWNVYSFDAEGGHGQHEFDFAYADALTMADRLIFFRFMAKSIAREMGLFASFMPKPFADDFRSGAHFNMSLYDHASGANMFAAGGGALAAKHGIDVPDVAYHFVGGLLDHAGAVTAVTNPTHNSYKGLLAKGEMVDVSWAPVLRTYGKNNRSAMLRLPMNRPCVENRTPDIAGNFYLGAAMSLAAGMDGVRRGVDPGAPMNDNLYLTLGAATASRRLPKEDGGFVERLPRTLIEALEAFEESELAAPALGQEMRDIYLGWKMKEWERDFYAVDDAERARALSLI